MRELDHNQKVKRAEMFAMASLLHEIISGMQPFEGLTDGEVQPRFSNGDFPDDAISLPYSLSVRVSVGGQDEPGRDGTVALFQSISHKLCRSAFWATVSSGMRIRKWGGGLETEPRVRGKK